jgi:hypothetical protein
MGLEMKTPENCENSLRNRKKKENVAEKSERVVKKTTEKVENHKVEQSQEENLKIKEKSAEKLQSEAEIVSDVQSKDFRIRIEFDPMSIALFTLAIVTRFFRLSEPRNIV